MALDATVGGPSADTYVTEAEYRAYASAYGWTLSGDIEVHLRRARAYLDRAFDYLGAKASSGQALAWPRLVGDILVDGYSVASDALPQAIKDAQCEMAYLIQGGADPFATITGGAVSRKREKVDVIDGDTTYVAGTARDRAAYPAVDQLVAPYATGKAGQRSLSYPLVRA